jgi:hypothetical protein
MGTVIRAALKCSWTKRRGEDHMRKTLILAAAGFAIASGNAQVQVDFSSYADANGFINV